MNGFPPPVTGPSRVGLGTAAAATIGRAAAESTATSAGAATPRRFPMSRCTLPAGAMGKRLRVVLLMKPELRRSGPLRATRAAYVGLATERRCAKDDDEPGVARRRRTKRGPDCLVRALVDVVAGDRSLLEERAARRADTVVGHEHVGLGLVQSAVGALRAAVSGANRLGARLGELVGALL